MKRVLWLVVLLLIGCATTGIEATTPAMDRWVGADVKNLIIVYGNPTYTKDDGNGGQILTYVYSGTERSYSPKTYSYTVPGRDGRPGGIRYGQLPGKTTLHTYTRIKEYYVDKNGKIYKTFEINR